VGAFLHLVVMDQFGERPLCPAPRRWIEFVREDDHGNRDGDTLGIEIPEFAPILPIQTDARERRVRQPIDRNVVVALCNRPRGLDAAKSTAPALL
jgi:hypothetical protein